MRIKSGVACPITQSRGPVGPRLIWMRQSWFRMALPGQQLPPLRTPPLVGVPSILCGYRPGAPVAGWTEGPRFPEEAVFFHNPSGGRRGEPPFPSPKNFTRFGKGRQKAGPQRGPAGICRALFAGGAHGAIAVVAHQGDRDLKGPSSHAGVGAAVDSQFHLIAGFKAISTWLISSAEATAVPLTWVIMSPGTTFLEAMSALGSTDKM